MSIVQKAMATINVDRHRSQHVAVYYIGPVGWIAYGSDPSSSVTVAHTAESAIAGNFESTPYQFADGGCSDRRIADLIRDYYR